MWNSLCKRIIMKHEIIIECITKIVIHELFVSNSHYSVCFYYTFSVQKSIYRIYIKKDDAFIRTTKDLGNINLLKEQ